MANRRFIHAQMVSNTKISGAQSAPDIFEIKKIVDINHNVCHISKALNAKAYFNQAKNAGVAQW
jgi:organic hydroperoxide reductase OsmC/OhrA